MEDETILSMRMIIEAFLNATHITRSFDSNGYMAPGFEPNGYLTPGFDITNLRPYEKLKKLPEFSNWFENKFIPLFSSYTGPSSYGTVDNMLLNTIVYGIDDTIYKFLQNIDTSHQIKYYTCCSLKGITINKSYKIDEFDLLPLKDCPTSFIEDIRLKLGYSRYPSTSPAFREYQETPVLMIERRTTIVDKPDDCDIFNDDFTIISQKMYDISLLLPLIVRKPVFSGSKYDIIDKDFILYTGSGYSGNLCDIYMSSCYLVEIDIDKLEHIFAKFQNLDQELKCRLSVILTRFNYSCARFSACDQAIELRIVIESLLANNLTQESITRTISQRGALLMGKTEIEQTKITKFIKDSYNITSRAVHGNFNFKSNYINKINKFREFCSELILLFIDVGLIPTESEWESIILGKSLIEIKADRK